jgi:outer membrane protein
VVNPTLFTAKDYFRLSILRPVKTLRFSIALLFGFLLQDLSAQTNERWTLNKCIDYALEHNVAIRQAGINAQVNKNNYTQSYMNLLPGINGSLSNDITNGQQFSLAAFRVVNETTTTFNTVLNADLTLFSGLQQVHNILKSKSDLTAAQYDMLDSRNTMILNITTAFLQIMLNQEILTVAENQKLLTTLQRDLIEKRVKAGALPETSLLDIEAQMARDASSITSAKNSVNLAKLSLRMILQLKPEDAFEIELPTLVNDISDLLGENTAYTTFQTAVVNQPSILAQMARVRSAQYSRKMAIGALSPTITLNGSLFDFYTNQQKRFDTVALDFKTIPINEQFRDQFRKSVTVTLNIPIFNRWQRMTNIANAKLQYQNAQLQLETTKNSLMQTIYEADANAKAAADGYAASKKSVDAARRAFDAQEKRYNAGVGSSLDYQTSKNNLASAESELIRNKFTYVFRLKVLDFYQGKAITLN